MAFFAPHAEPFAPCQRQFTDVIICSEVNGVVVLEFRSPTVPQGCAASSHKVQASLLQTSIRSSCPCKGSC